MYLNRGCKPIESLLIGNYLSDQFEERNRDCGSFTAENDIPSDCLAVLVDFLLLLEVAGDESLTASATLNLETVQNESQLDSGPIDAVVIQLRQRGQLFNTPPLLVHQRDLHRGQTTSLLHEPVD